MREVEQQELKPWQHEEILSIAEKKDKEAKKTGKTLLVKGFKFTSTEALPTKKLNDLLKQYIGKTVDIGELDIATSIIANHYIKQGYVVKVFTPPQEIKDGIVEIKIIVGNYEGSRIDKTKTRFKKTIATQIIDAAQADLKPLKLDRLERGMLILNDLPGVYATSVLRPGKKVGGVLVDLDVKDTPLITSNVSFDDYGLHTIGNQRGAAHLNVNDPLSIGDQLRGIFVYSGLLKYGSLMYSLPLGDEGVQAGLATNILHYQLGEAWSATSGKGSALTIGPHISYPIIRSRDKNIRCLISYYYKRFITSLYDATTRDNKINVGHVFVTADAYDSFLSGGYTSGGIGWSLGNADLKGNQDNYDTDSDGRKTHGIYNKLVFSLFRTQRVADKTALELKIRGQYAFRNLDSSEQFELGGPEAVRGYAVGDGNGDHGFIATAELVRELFTGLNISGFYDFGYIVQNYRTYDGWRQSDAPANGYSLGSVGVGLKWSPVRWFSGKVVIATATQHNPLLKNEPKGFSAGIGRCSKVWFQASLSF